MKKKLIGLIVLYALCSSLIIGETTFEDLPIYEQIVWIITSLKYKKGFVEDLRHGEKLRVGLFYANTEDSIKYKEDFFAVFNREFKDKSFYDRQIKLEAIRDIESLRSWNFHLLFIAPDVGQSIEKILEITANKKILSATGVTEYLQSGITVVVGFNGKKGVLYVNMKNSEREDCLFNANFLQFVKKVDKQ